MSIFACHLLPELLRITNWLMALYCRVCLFVNLLSSRLVSPRLVSIQNSQSGKTLNDADKARREDILVTLGCLKDHPAVPGSICTCRWVNTRVTHRNGNTVVPRKMHGVRILLCREVGPIFSAILWLLVTCPPRTISCLFPRDGCQFSKVPLVQNMTGLSHTVQRRCWPWSVGYVDGRWCPKRLLWMILANILPRP
jgi:hypothetical protein